MTRPEKRVVVDEAFALDYSKRREIAEQAGGWIRSSGPEGESATVWHGDTEYVFTGRGLIEFMYAVKDVNVAQLREALAFCEYVEKAATQPPSVYVRDAIVTRAKSLKALISGEVPDA